MSTRELAINIFNTLNEEQLIEFIKTYSDNSVGKKVNDVEKKAEERDLDEKRRALEELNQFVDKYSHLIATDDYKEDLAAYRREKYGL